jgi:hypothetical protein
MVTVDFRYAQAGIAVPCLKDLDSRLVIGEKRDGRREYDEAARDELVRMCLKPGV